MYEYENTTRKVYGGWWFIPRCPQCGRIVKADDSISINGLGDYKRQPNATCARCGRVQMPCDGNLGDPEEI